MTTITVTTKDGNKVADCEVTVEQTDDFTSEYVEIDRENSIKIESKKTQEINKLWTINFNKEINLDQNLKSNIFVVDKDNKSQNIDIEFGEDLKSIKILPPKDGYKTGQTYTILIKDIESESGKEINNVTIMDFDIE